MIRRHFRRYAEFRVDTFAVAALSVVPLAAVAPARADHPQPGTSWQRHVVAPTSRDVRPVRVLAATGGITNPAGLLADR